MKEKKNMILLEAESAIIRNLLERSLDPNERLSETYHCCDFDGVSFSFKVERPKGKGKKGKSGDDDEDGEATTTTLYPIIVEMKLPCWEAIKEYGAEEAYQKLYGDMIVEPNAKEGNTHAVRVCFEGKSDQERKDLITLIARLKTNLLGAPLLWVAEKHAAKENFAPFEIPYRASTGESMYVCPAEKGAIVIFTIRFSDPGDHVIGNVFLTELQAARTRVPSAPVVVSSDKPPKELEAFDIPSTVIDGNYAFVSVSLLDPQLSERKRQDTATYVPMFRDYIHYHIKCTKAYLHQKMRIRTNLLLKILHDAKPEPKVKVARTVTGKIVNH